MTLASKPADKEHPYGHGRIELLSGLAVGLILAAGGIGICYRSLQSVTEVQAPPRAYSAYPLIFAILVRSVMSVIKFRVGRGIGSVSVIADAWNDAVDVLSAVAALCALALTFFNPSKFLMADHYGGFAVGLFVIYTGLRVLRDASLDLIDTMPPTTLIEKVRATAMRVHGVVGVEKAFGRKIGLQHQLDLHLEVDPTISVSVAHEIAANVRARIRADLPEIADVLVHIEPHGLGGK
jgi:cation diffusion facilitator family transporter